MVRPDRTILLDANLLVLLVVGTTSRRLVEKHKKTRVFTIADFDRLVAVLGKHRLLILPHIAAEASDLIRFHQEPERERLLEVLRTVLGAISERYVASREAAREQEFHFVGLTDAAILAASADAEILTTDAMLHVAALKRGLSATNFNHLR